MRNNKRRYNQIKKKSKIIRCKTHNRPVFEHETCSLFSSKSDTNNDNTCVNCKSSF
jgi:hypothetical protein